MAWPSAFVAGNTLTASQLNGIQAAGLAWTAYTPTITTGGVAITLGNGALDCAWQSFGKTIFFRVALDVGSTTTLPAGTVVVGLPTAAKSTSTGHAVGTYVTASPNGEGAFRNVSTTTIQLYAGSTLQTVATLGLVSGTTLLTSGFYEGA